MSNSELAWVVVCGFRLEEGCPGLWCGLGCLTGLKGFGEAYLVRSFETDCGLCGFGGFWMSREDSWRVSDCIEAMVGGKFNLSHGTAFASRSMSDIYSWISWSPCSYLQDPSSNIEMNLKLSIIFLFATIPAIAPRELAKRYNAVAIVDLTYRICPRARSDCRAMGQFAAGLDITLDCYTTENTTPVNDDS